MMITPCSREMVKESVDVRIELRAVKWEGTVMVYMSFRKASLPSPLPSSLIRPEWVVRESQHDWNPSQNRSIKL